MSSVESTSYRPGHLYSLEPIYTFPSDHNHLLECVHPVLTENTSYGLDLHFLRLARHRRCYRRDRMNIVTLLHLFLLEYSTKQLLSILNIYGQSRPDGIYQDRTNDVTDLPYLSVTSLPR